MIAVPATGTALSTKFRLAAIAWTDTDAPLAYRFTAQIKGEENVLQLQDFGPRSEYEGTLPGGLASESDVVIVGVQVRDSLGAVSVIAETEVTSSWPVLATEAAATEATTVYDAAGSVTATAPPESHVSVEPKKTTTSSRPICGSTATYSRRPFGRSSSPLREPHGATVTRPKSTCEPTPMRIRSARMRRRRRQGHRQSGGGEVWDGSSSIPRQRPAGINVRRRCGGSVTQSFAECRGQVLGLSKCFVGMSAALFSSAYIGFFQPDVVSFLLFIGLEYCLVCSGVVGAIYVLRLFGANGNGQPVHDRALMLLKEHAILSTSS